MKFCNTIIIILITYFHYLTPINKRMSKKFANNKDKVFTFNHYSLVSIFILLS